MKLVHPVGFTIGIYYDARTYERQMFTVSLRLPVGLSKDDITPWSMAYTGVCGCGVDVSVPRNVRYPRKLSFPLTVGTGAVRWSFFFYISSYSMVHFKINELYWTTVFMKFRLLTLGPINTCQILHFFFSLKTSLQLHVSSRVKRSSGCIWFYKETIYRYVCNIVGRVA